MFLKNETRSPVEQSRQTNNRRLLGRIIDTTVKKLLELTGIEVEHRPQGTIKNLILANPELLNQPWDNRKKNTPNNKR